MLNRLGQQVGLGDDEGYRSCAGSCTLGSATAGSGHRPHLLSEKPFTACLGQYGGGMIRHSSPAISDLSLACPRLLPAFPCPIPHRRLEPQQSTRVAPRQVGKQLIGGTHEALPCWMVGGIRKGHPEFTLQALTPRLRRKAYIGLTFAGPRPISGREWSMACAGRRCRQQADGGRSDGTMRRLAVFALLFAMLLVSTPSSPLQAQGPPDMALPCMQSEELEQLLAEEYDELPMMRGVSADGALVTMFAAQATGTWTMAVTYPMGVSCVVAEGAGFELLADALAARPDPIPM